MFISEALLITPYVCYLTKMAGNMAVSVKVNIRNIQYLCYY